MNERVRHCLPALGVSTAYVGNLLPGSLFAARRIIRKKSEDESRVDTGNTVCPFIIPSAATDK
jgi:hypothetical protein